MNPLLQPLIDLKEQGSKIATDYLEMAKRLRIAENARPDAVHKLSALCRTNVNLKARVLVLALSMDSAKQFYVETRERARDKRNQDINRPKVLDKKMGSFVKKQINALDVLYGPLIPADGSEIDEKIRDEISEILERNTVKEFSRRISAASQKPHKRFKLHYKKFLKAIVLMVMAQTGKPVGNRPKRDACNRLADFLNAMNFTNCPGNHPFTGRKIRDTIDSIPND